MNEHDPLRPRAARLILDLPLDRAEVVMDILEDVLLALREAYDARIRWAQALSDGELPIDALAPDPDDTPF